MAVRLVSREAIMLVEKPNDCRTGEFLFLASMPFCPSPSVNLQKSTPWENWLAKTFQLSIAAMH
ncbi:unnamed protein product [Haemonchus placei]|uniref:RNA pseudouridine synthase n=1 Tax=Haemonchus placei TaxID=6290 RepID=A0A0N4VT39_HAEPC|nr:unnamed protein product [Haemonchus placei]